MAWNPSPKVAECREIARKHGKQIVILLMIDAKARTLESASYGETTGACQVAKHLSDVAYDAIVDEYADVDQTDEGRAFVDAEVERLRKELKL